MTEPGIEWAAPDPEPAGALPAGVLASIVDHVLEGVAIVDAAGRCTYLNDHARLLLGAANDREASAWVEAAIACPGAPGRGQWPDLQFRLASLDGESGYRVVTFRDVSELRVSQGRLEALSRAVARITESGTLGDTLDAVALEVKETLQLAAVNIVMLGSAAGRPLHILGGAGFVGTAQERTLQMRQTEALGAEFKYREVMQTGRPVVVPHRRGPVMSDPRWAPSVALGAVEWDGFVATPLLARGRLVGTLSAFYPPDVAADATDEVSLFTIMADQAAVAVDNAGLLAQTQWRAASKERNRLARDLHDSIVQDVFSLAVHSRTIQVSAEMGGPLAEKRIRAGAADLIELSRSALTSLRALIFELRPPALQDHSVVDAVRAYAATMARRSEVPIEVIDERSKISLSDAASEHVYRVVQEALHNAVRHAAASRITARFRMDDEHGGNLVVEVIDDGVGFDVQAVGAEHLGLVSMRERAEVVDGTLEVSSRPGQGTRITLQVPWSAPEPPDDARPEVAI